jgi:hypothetical protein
MDVSSCGHANKKGRVMKVSLVRHVPAQTERLEKVALGITVSVAKIITLVALLALVALTEGTLVYKTFKTESAE